MKIFAKTIAQADVGEFKGSHYTNRIINFAEVGELLYRPVKSIQLEGYVCAVSFKYRIVHRSELVILDEVLSPVDRNFYFKAVQKDPTVKKDTGVTFIVSEVRPVIIRDAL